MEFGCRLDEILARKDIRMKELAAMTDLNYSHLSDLKRERKFPTVKTAILIAEALNMRVEEIWQKK